MWKSSKAPITLLEPNINLLHFGILSSRLQIAHPHPSPFYYCPQKSFLSTSTYPRVWVDTFSRTEEEKKWLCMRMGKVESRKVFEGITHKANLECKQKLEWKVEALAWWIHKVELLIGLLDSDERDEIHHCFPLLGLAEYVERFLIQW